MNTACLHSRTGGRKGVQRMDTGHTFSNHEIVTLSLYLLGGSTTTVDTEDIAVKANEIAPGKFTWRKYPDQINIDTVRVALSDAKKKAKGVLVAGSHKGWMLTEAGHEYGKKNVVLLKTAQTTPRSRSPQERKWYRSQRLRMLASQAFEKFSAGDSEGITARAAADFFRIDDYIVGESRKRTLNRIVNAFGQDPELGAAVRALTKKLREGEGDERV